MASIIISDSEDDLKHQLLRKDDSIQIIDENEQPVNGRKRNRIHISKGNGKGKGKEREPIQILDGESEESEESLTESEGQVGIGSSTQTKKKKKKRLVDHDEKFKELVNGGERDLDRNRDKGKGKARFISPPLQQQQQQQQQQTGGIISIDDGSDSEIEFIGKIKSPSRKKGSKVKERVRVGSSSNKRVRLNSNQPSTFTASTSEEVIKFSKEIFFKQCLNQLLQILPDLDPSCAKKRLELVVKELEFTPQGEGNEMVMSRAMELLMNLEGGYPKRQIGLTLSSSDEDSEEEDIEISENEDEGEVENVPCGCCFDDELPSRKLIACSLGLHKFCPDCCRRTVEMQLGLQKVEIKCMDGSNCEASFENRQIKKFLGKKQFKLLEKLRQEKEIENAGLEGLETCPFCSFGCIIERSKEEEKLFRCQGRNCGKISCRSCKELEHLPKSCKENADDKSSGSRHKLEEELSKVLIRKCPTEGCGTTIVKDDGCNKMTCPKCRKNMCYVCRETIQDYSHFDQNPANYRAPKESSKCPLWENSDDRHKLEREEFLKKHGKEDAEVGGSAPIRERPPGWVPQHVAHAAAAGYQLGPDGVPAPLHGGGGVAGLMGQLGGIRDQIAQLMRMGPAGERAAAEVAAGHGIQIPQLQNHQAQQIQAAQLAQLRQLQAQAANQARRLQRLQQQAQARIQVQAAVEAQRAAQRAAQVAQAQRTAQAQRAQAEQIRAFVEQRHQADLKAVAERDAIRRRQQEAEARMEKEARRAERESREAEEAARRRGRISEANRIAREREAGRDVIPIAGPVASGSGRRGNNAYAPIQID